MDTIKRNHPKIAHAHHIFENKACLPWPTLIRGLRGVISSKCTTIKVEFSIKEKYNEWKVEAELRGWNRGEFNNFSGSYLYLYTRHLFLHGLSYQLPLEKSILSSNQCHLCMIHMGCFLFFFCLPNIFYFQELLPPRPETW